MKIPFLILFIIYFNYGATQEEWPEKRIVVKSYPKKVRTGMFQINFSNKYINQKKLDEQMQQQIAEGKKYTAFVPIDKKKSYNVPGSLLFPNDPLFETKSRVKKVLPDYGWSAIRRKRSANVKKTHVAAKRKAANGARAGAKFRKSKAGALKLRNKKTRKGKKGVKRDKTQRSIKKGKRGSSRKGKKSKNNKMRGKSPKKPQRELNVQENTRRLIAARDATIEEYPYMVSIQKNKEHWCGGAILNPRLIITTANCMWKGNQISHMKVRVGSRYTHQGGQVFKIQEVMRHPGWMIRQNPDCDVALALLNGYIRFSHSVHAVDLPNYVMMPPFDDAWVTSWGSERRDGVFDNLGNSLQVYHVRLMDHDKCNNITERFRVSVTRNFICLAQTGRRAPCTRDTGAPAVSDGVLWGLASWGIRKLCGTERYPAMFSYLASPDNLEFITNATHYIMAEERHYPFPDKWPRVKVTPTTPTPVTLPYY